MLYKNQTVIPFALIARGEMIYQSAYYFQYCSVCFFGSNWNP